MKQFQCYWGAGYSDNSIEETHDMAYFCSGNGYNDDDIQKIRQLQEGECLDLTNPSGHHTVTRLNDTGDPQ